VHGGLAELIPRKTTRLKAAAKRPDALADGVLTVEPRARVRLIDDGDTRVTAPIRRLEQAARERANAERGEVIGRDLAAYAS